MPLPSILRLAAAVALAVRYRLKFLIGALIALVAALALIFAAGKLYQHMDRDPDRGAIAMEEGALGEHFDTPIYLDQGWSPAESLWYYNTTQGSALLPYDLFIALEQADSEALFRSDRNMDRYRYLPQKPTLFNPDGLPVGMTRDEYQGRDYMGFTCAACHTGQINYRGQAIRIDGGPAMADMVGFLEGLQEAMATTAEQPAKRDRFVEKVLALDNDYDKPERVLEDLNEWAGRIEMYNAINHTEVDYGYARLDAFGRIFNRVLRHVINPKQLRGMLLAATDPAGEPLLTPEQADRVLAGLDPTLIDEQAFTTVLQRLRSDRDGLPGLNREQLMQLRDELFNEPDAPVSYPFLWDITHSDYVQWNGLANNAKLGPLGRNVGEVLGVFAELDWEAKDPGLSISAWLSGQDNKQKRVAFKSSVNLVNLQRLEAHLGKLTSPQWPEDILGEIDRDLAAQGKRLYDRHCLECHQVINPTAWDRKVIGKMSSLEEAGTDPKMALNSVQYTGKSGNFKNTLQDTSVGPVVVEENAPVIEILRSVTKGTVATADPDKGPIRRGLDWLYTLGLTWFDNDVKFSIKAGDYDPSTTANPYRSLRAYKARSLNGIWATAPYLHNGSVPTLYDLLLPARRPGDPEGGEYRPEQFEVGSREFDPEKVGFRTEGYEGFTQTTDQLGNYNTGHDYGTDELSEQDRWALVEYLKTL